MYINEEEIATKETFMKTKYLMIFAITMFISKTNGMEIIQLSEQTNKSTHIHTSKNMFKQVINYFSKQPLVYNPVINKQLDLPEDIFDKIIANTSHKGCCALQLTCKQLYHLASLNRLKNFLLHDFTIGDKKEKELLFKNLIKKNNPTLITPLLNHAQKEAQSLAQDTICIELNIEKKKKEKQYIQSSYLNTLLEEAIKQEHSQMINVLSKEENIDTNMITQYFREKCDKKWLIGIVSCITIPMITGLIIGLNIGLPACNTTSGCLER